MTQSPACGVIGCTEAELEFILGESLDGDGQRVELNAMTSRQLVDLDRRQAAESTA